MDWLVVILIFALPSTATEMRRRLARPSRTLDRIGRDGAEKRVQALLQPGEPLRVMPARRIQRGVSGPFALPQCGYVMQTPTRWWWITITAREPYWVSSLLWTFTDTALRTTWAIPRLHPSAKVVEVARDAGLTRASYLFETVTDARSFEHAIRSPIPAPPIPAATVQGREYRRECGWCGKFFGENVPTRCSECESPTHFPTTEEDE